MTVFEVVSEAFKNAYQNGYREEFNKMSDEYIADDMIDCGVFDTYNFSVDEILQAIKQYRKGF